MPATTYNKCVKLLEELKGQEVGFIKLNSMILTQIGSDPRTTHNTLKMMLETKLIKDIGNMHFRIL